MQAGLWLTQSPQRRWAGISQEAFVEFSRRTGAVAKLPNQLTWVRVFWACSAVSELGTLAAGAQFLERDANLGETSHQMATMPSSPTRNACSFRSANSGPPFNRIARTQPP